LKGGGGLAAVPPVHVDTTIRIAVNVTDAIRIIVIILLLVGKGLLVPRFLTKPERRDKGKLIENVTNKEKICNCFLHQKTASETSRTILCSQSSVADLIRKD
jgi:hypothetical protein